MDLVGTLDLARHSRCLEIIARADVVDSVITLGTMGATSSFQSFVVEGQIADEAMRDRIKPKVITSDFVRQLRQIDEAYRGQVLSLMEETRKPIIAVSFPTSGALSPALAQQSEVVIYPSPERGAKTLAALHEYQEFLDRKKELV